MRKQISGTVLALALGAGALAGPARAATIKTVALQNQMSPLASYFYRKFREVAVSDATGQHVAVFAQLSGPKCLFKLDPDGGGNATAACQKDVTPDNRLFGNFGLPSINVAGNVGFSARVTQGRSGVFQGDPAYVAATGDPVPAPATGLMKTFSVGGLTDAGDVVFETTISGGAVMSGVEVNQGIFRCVGGNGDCSTQNGGTGTLTTLALVDDAVPDRAGREFCSFAELAASTFGVAFRALTKLDCANTAEPEAVGVFRLPLAGAIETVALQGEPANSFPPSGGTTYATLLEPAIANTGMVAFRATTAGLLVTSALYRCAPATCPASPADVVVSAGETDGAGNVFSAFSAPGVSDVGDVAFDARIRQGPGAHDGLYIKRVGGTLDTIAVGGDPVPGSNPPGAFRDMARPRMSPGGKVVFPGRERVFTTHKTLRGVFVFE